MKRELYVVSQKRHYTVNNLPGFLDAQNANLIHTKTRFLIKFEQTDKVIYGAHFRFDNFLIQLSNLISKPTTSPKLLAHYVNYPSRTTSPNELLMEFTC
jgi:hypothetical protein